VNHPRTQPNFLRRALRLALCYLLALQAITAAVAAALAVGHASTAGFTICHSLADAPSNNAGAPQVPCALCAAAASAVVLSDPPSVVIGSPTLTRRVRPADVAVVARPPPRSGLARAPPHFA
jgi:hypothetical protein